MKKFFLPAIACCMLSIHCHAQDTVYLRKKNNNSIVYTDRPPQVLLIELYGRGLVYSANYDTRFKKQIGGAGFSAGLGVLTVSGFTVITIPVSFNYLMGGTKGKFFETGAGITYLNTKSSDIFNSDSPRKSSTLMGNFTFGYRSQPLNEGFCFRAGLNLLAGGGYFGPYPYISFGYSF